MRLIDADNLNFKGQRKAVINFQLLKLIWMLSQNFEKV